MPAVVLRHKDPIRWYADYLEQFLELAAMLAALPRARRIRHPRDQGGRHEIDLILELGRRHGIIAIEIKAAAEVNARDARHLIWLRDELGEQFASGIVLHTGPDGFELADRVVAAPIDLLWAEPSRGAVA